MTAKSGTRKSPSKKTLSAKKSAKSGRGKTKGSKSRFGGGSLKGSKSKGSLTIQSVDSSLPVKSQGSSTKELVDIGKEPSEASQVPPNPPSHGPVGADLPATQGSRPLDRKTPKEENDASPNGTLIWFILGGCCLVLVIIVAITLGVVATTHRSANETDNHTVPIIPANYRHKS